MNRIAELRKSKGITQIDLAKKLGIAQNTLSQYENELRNPSASIILSIAEIFGVSTRYLLGLPDTDAEQEEAKDSIQDVTAIQELYSTYNSSIISELNLALQNGWKLLHVGTVTEQCDCGSAGSCICYTLGWFGPSSDAPYIRTEDDSLAHLQSW